MARPKTRPQPNVTHPLGESTIQRRLWALYLARGFDRAGYARALGVSYQTVDRWDQGLSMPDLPLFLRACELLKVSPNDVALGLDASSVAPGSSPGTIVAPDDDLSPEERAALEATVRAYVSAIRPTFLAVYRVEREAGLDPEEARSKAQAAAHNLVATALKKRAVIEAVTAGGKPVHTAKLAGDLKRAARSSGKKRER